MGFVVVVLYTVSWSAVHAASAPWLSSNVDSRRLPRASAKDCLMLLLLSFADIPFWCSHALLMSFGLDAYIEF